MLLLSLATLPVACISYMILPLCIPYGLTTFFSLTGCLYNDPRSPTMHTDYPPTENIQMLPELCPLKAFLWFQYEFSFPSAVTSFPPQWDVSSAEGTLPASGIRSVKLHTGQVGFWCISFLKRIMIPKGGKKKIKGKIREATLRAVVKMDQESPVESGRRCDSLLTGIRNMIHHTVLRVSRWVERCFQAPRDIFSKYRPSFLLSMT